MVGVDKNHTTWATDIANDVRVKPEAIYIYTDKYGEELFEVLRWLNKRFSQHAVDPVTGCRFSDMTLADGSTVVIVPYWLPELLIGISEDRWINVPEGEKDVETLRALGLVATCSPGGAKKGLSVWADPSFTQWFKGAKVNILLDRDDAGKMLARAEYESLKGVASRLRVYRARVGKDVTDHIEAGLSLKQLIRVRPSSLPPLDPLSSSLRPSWISDVPQSTVLTLVIKELERLDCRPIAGRSGWMFYCPCHLDQRQSASIKTGVYRPLLYHCFAGCSFVDFSKWLIENTSITRDQLMDFTGPQGRVRSEDE
jgi:5S rRNA maturation endonuclease (ribonuclease M5)